MTKPKIAIIYDFDKTLSKTEMQTPFIKRLGMKDDVFWKEATKFAEKNQMDKILAYLYYMKDKCMKMGVPFNKKVLKEKEVRFIFLNKSYVF